MGVSKGQETLETQGPAKPVLEGWQWRNSPTMMGWLRTPHTAPAVLPSIRRALGTHLPHSLKHAVGLMRQRLYEAQKEPQVLPTFVARGPRPSQYTHLMCNLSLPSLSRTRV